MKKFNIKVMVAVAGRQSYQETYVWARTGRQARAQAVAFYARPQAVSSVQVLSTEVQ